MDTQTQPQDIDIPKLARSIRFAFVGIILGLSYFSFRGSLTLDHFSRVFVEMLGDQPLPTITVFVIRTRYLFVTISILVPAIALATLFLRDFARSFYILGSLGFITTFELVLLYHGISAPFAEIIRRLNA